MRKQLPITPKEGNYYSQNKRRDNRIFLYWSKNPTALRRPRL